MNGVVHKLYCFFLSITSLKRAGSYQYHLVIPEETEAQVPAFLGHGSCLVT